MICLFISKDHREQLLVCTLKCWREKKIPGKTKQNLKKITIFPESPN